MGRVRVSGGVLPYIPCYCIGVYIVKMGHRRDSVGIGDRARMRGKEREGRRGMDSLGLFEGALDTPKAEQQRMGPSRWLHLPDVLSSYQLPDAVRGVGVLPLRRARP